MSVPEHESARDMFRISREAMAALFRHMGSAQAFVAAPVHSHPHEAFHSLADDTWAIVRHVGALSLVVPRFARVTTADSFCATSAVLR